jgi:hypothetical protein
MNNHPCAVPIPVRPNRATVSETFQDPTVVAVSSPRANETREVPSGLVATDRRSPCTAGTGEIAGDPDSAVHEISRTAKKSTGVAARERGPEIIELA